MPGSQDPTSVVGITTFHFGLFPGNVWSDQISGAPVNSPCNHEIYLYIFMIEYPPFPWVARADHSKASTAH